MIPGECYKYVFMALKNMALLGIVSKFCIPFGTEIKIYGELDSDCTEVTPHRAANFRVEHLKSDIEQTRRGIKLLVLPHILPAFIFLYRFLVKNIVDRPKFRVKIF